MRSLHLIRTSCTALIAGALTFAIAAGAASGATELRDGSFADDASYATPSGLSPASGAALTMPSSPLAFSWDAVPGASAYELQVALRATAEASCEGEGAFSASNVVLTTTTSDTGVTPEMIEDDNGKRLVAGAYCWRVRAAGAANAPWSSAGGFTLTSSLEPSGLKFYNDTDGWIPRRFGDADLATGSTKTRDSGYLTWDPIDGAVGYDVQVARSPMFASSSVSLTVSRHIANSVSLPTLYDGHYFWRVRGVTSNDQRSAWSATSEFAVERSTPVPAGSTYPANGATVTDARIGWEPVPGASYYEVQTATSRNGFWDDGTPVPNYYGAAGSTAAPNYRLSATKAITLNNWATTHSIFSREVLDAFRTNCGGTTLPCAAGSNDLPIDAVNGKSVFWRVRPVWSSKQQNESLWKRDGDATFYGAWIEDTTGTSPRPFEMKLARDTVYDSNVTTLPSRCDHPRNPIPSGECLRLENGTMSPSDPSTNSTSLQMPLLRWGSVVGRGQAQPGGFLVQIARDPLFNHVVSSYSPSDGSMFLGVERSRAVTDALPDGTYWWRAVPCQSSASSSYCELYHYIDARMNGFSDAAAPRMFTKNTAMQTRSSDGFGGTAPLLLVAARTASTPQDWAKGMQGAETYQFQLSRSPDFAQSENKDISCSSQGVLCASTPRIHPMRAAGEGRFESLDPGVWYWRARAMDHNGVAGSWSDTASFDITLPAPQLVTAAGESGPGVVVRWRSIPTVSSYVVEYATDPSFAGATSITTRQLAARIPATAAGTYYWRVRGELATSGNERITGTWSSSGRVLIVPPTRLRYAVSADTVNAGARATFQAQLLVGGSPAAGRSVQLQRKSTACDAPGTYQAITSASTATAEGIAKMPALVLYNACYRLAYIGDKVVYSAPFSVGAKPIVKYKVAKKARKVRRRARTCAAVTSNRPITGTVTYQYRKNNKAAWTNAGSGKVRNLRKGKLCFLLPKAGTYQVQASYTNLVHPSQGWTMYQPTTAQLGTFKVVDVWKKVTVKKKAKAKAHKRARR